MAVASLDQASCVYRSPVGLLKLVATSKGMQTLKWLSTKNAQQEGKSRYFDNQAAPGGLVGDVSSSDVRKADWRESSRVVSWEPIETVNAEQQQAVENIGLCVNWLDAYFSGTLLKSSPPVARPPLAIPSEGTFFHRVWHTLASTGVGETLSYGQLAQMSGSPKAARAAGQAVRSHGLPILIPCHRVVRSGGVREGRVGNYSGGEGPKTKEWLLKHEKKMACEKS